MKKVLAIGEAICVLLCTAVIPAYAENGTPITNAMYATTMEINSAYGGLGKLNALNQNGSERPNTAYEAANGVHFQTGGLVPGEDYIEMDLQNVTEVEALRIRSRGNLQRLDNARISYLDNQDGKWKNAFESIDCSEDKEDALLYWKNITFPKAVKTAKIRIYPLSWYKDYGQIRLDGIQAIGTETNEKLYGNLLYGSELLLESEGTWQTGKSLNGSKTIDGSYQFSTDTVIYLEGKNRSGEITYTLPEKRVIDYVEVTSYYPQHSFHNGTVSAWDENMQIWDVVGSFEAQYKNATFGRMYAKLQRTVSTEKLKISFDDGAPGQSVTLSEVYAGAFDYTKLDSLYFANYSLIETNTDACNTELNHLHEDGSAWNKNPGDSGYGNDYDCVFFRKDKAIEPKSNHLEMLFSTPAELQRIVVKTSDAGGGFGKPNEISVSYLDHEAQEWIEDGTIQIPDNEYITDYFFSDRVYADAVRVSVLKISGAEEQFKLAGLYAVGNAKNERHNNQNLLYGAGIKDNQGTALGKLADGNFATGTFNVSSSNRHLWVNPVTNGRVNQIELVYKNAHNAIPKLVLSYYGDGGWHNDIEECTFPVPTGQTYGEQQNPVRYRYNLSKAYPIAPGQTWSLRIEELTGSTSLMELIFCEREVHNISEFTADGVFSEDSVYAEVSYHGNETKNTKLLIALYDESNRLQRVVSKRYTFSETDSSASIEMTAENKETQGRIYIWDQSDLLLPISEPLSLNHSVRLQTTADELDIHNTAMESYLKDRYDNAEKYANGKQHLDKPEPIELRWSWTSSKAVPEEYLVQISENQEMTDVVAYTTKQEYLELYNLKVGTRYYWTVSYTDQNGTHTSELGSFYTKADAPRILKVDGVRNIRDIGGWSTEDGGRVKQGMLLRSWRLSYYQNGAVKTEIEPDGIQTLCGEMKLRTEIDIRDWSEMPQTVTDSVLGDGVRYVRAPMNYQEDYLSQNLEAIRKIFHELSREENYPILYHCAAGADRTAAITYLINGLLGVSKEDLLRDYMITNFSHQDGFRQLSGIEELYVRTLDEYHGNTLSDKIYNYLKEVAGVPEDELNFLLHYLKEKTID